MPTWVKVVLVVVLAGFAILAVGIVVAARWVRHRGHALMEEGKVVVADAERFGKGKEEEACMTESFARLKACDGFICEAKTKVFLTHCLGAANKSAETCNAVPRRSEIMASVRWQLDECSRRGMPNDQPCTRLLQGLQEYCAHER